MTTMITNTIARIDLLVFFGTCVLFVQEDSQSGQHWSHVSSFEEELVLLKELMIETTYHLG